MFKRLFLVTVCLFVASQAFAQSNGKVEIVSKDVGPIRSSPAYAEVLLRKTELLAEIEAYLADYTEENPRVIDTRTELTFLTADIDRLYAVKPSETGKLTQALGRLIVRRAALEVDLSRLLRNYNKDHPDVKRAMQRVKIFQSAIKEILG